MADFDAEFRGVGGGRPEHPDMVRLVDLVLRMDARHNPFDTDLPRDQMEATWKEVMLEAGIDGESLAYMASQRAMRVFGITNALELMTHLREVTVLTSVWMEAFVLGLNYERETPKS